MKIHFNIYRKGLIGMKYWMTNDGKYYASDIKMQPTDFQVTKRPHKKCIYVNGSWVCPNIVSLDTTEKYHHTVREYIQEPQPYNEVQKKENLDKKENVVLNENTKLLFGVKDILIIASFIITATLSWQDTDTRISKLEDSKAVENVDAKIKSLEIDIKALEKQTKDAQTKVEQNIRELEQIIFMKNALKHEMK